MTDLYAMDDFAIERAVEAYCATQYKWWNAPGADVAESRIAYRELTRPAIVAALLAARAVVAGRPRHPNQE